MTAPRPRERPHQLSSRTHVRNYAQSCGTLYGHLYTGREWADGKPGYVVRLVPLRWRALFVKTYERAARQHQPIMAGIGATIADAVRRGKL